MKKLLWLLPLPLALLLPLAQAEDTVTTPDGSNVIVNDSPDSATHDLNDDKGQDRNSEHESSDHESGGHDSGGHDGGGHDGGHDSGGKGGDD
ncbi:hypothetical protein [Vogesella oryzae]|uniref:hypothetical protein n=1 Tax=Vogesella oryzae TaxID=1735285 RepID=UPI00158368DD|nr:hypothetical protein [Vogesella oryzae]